jgi:hypothetical protein
MVCSRVDERVAGQSAFGMYQRKPDDWPERDVAFRKCRIGRYLYVAVCKWIDGRKCLEQERGRISFEYARDDGVSFSDFFCCVENIR